MDVVADTTFLVGLWRRQSWAVAYANANAGRALGVPWVVLGEFWYGALRAGHPESLVREFLSIGIPIADATAIVPVYARICADLQGGDPEGYRSVGQNDLWIAATAVGLGKPLVTRNQRHFGAIPALHLEVLAPDA